MAVAVAPRQTQAANLAQELILFADGAEEAGLTVYAQRARAVARETIWLADELEQERSLRQALQRRCDTQQELLGKRVYRRLQGQSVSGHEG